MSRSRRRTAAAVAAILLGLAALFLAVRPGRPRPATWEQFLAARPGMTHAEVEELFGAPGVPLYPRSVRVALPLEAGVGALGGGVAAADLAEPEYWMWPSGPRSAYALEFRHDVLLSSCEMSWPSWLQRTRDRLGI